MIVNIKTLNNDILRIEVGPTDLVIDAKQLICDKTQIGVARQRLIYRGRVLIDTDKLESYGITDGQTLHLVARPTRTETANDSNTESVPEASSSLLSSSGQTQQQVNQPEVVDLPNESPSNLEHIRQSLLTVNTILSTLHQDQSSNGAIFENFNSAGIKFYTGQWVDVKDTVSQWLEATILDVDHSNRRVFVHYNGWPARWDEWLPFDSPRIAPFRSRTAHSVVSNTFSPTPNVLLPNAPATGPDDIRVLLPELSRSISTVHQMLANTPLPNESVHDTSNYPWDVNIQARISESIDNDNDFRRHARDLAPLLDRVGRLMSDVSVQLWNQVEPGSYRTSPNPRTLDPLNTLEARLLSLLRERPPSPPTMRSYRAPISVSRLDQTRPSAQFLAPTLRGARPNPSGIEQQLDIHIAILSPQSRPGTAANLSQAMTDLSLNLHNQAQLIAARTQEISNRVNAVSQLNQSLSSAIQSLQSANNESIANTTISSEERTLNPTENETDLCALDDLSISAVTENAPISLIPEQALADHMDAHAQHMAPIDESQPAPVSDTPSAAIISNTEGQNEIGDRSIESNAPSLYERIRRSFSGRQ